MSGVIIPAAMTALPGERPDVVAAVARAAAAIARLDHALAGHPLLPAILYRARLDAVRRAAAVDGHAIDPWHLAALLEGLRLRMDPSLSLLDRGAIFDAARHAFDQYQWLVRPDFDEEGEIKAAERVLAGVPPATPLLAAAQGLYQWIDQGGDRRAGRAALLRAWQRHALLQAPFPLIAAAALRAEAPWAQADWLPVFLHAVADEAADGLQLVMTLERAWFSARSRTAAGDGRRRTSRAALAIDVMAAAPLVSATSLGRALGMAAQNARVLLEGFRRDGIALEVSHRTKRRLYGLTELAPLRNGVAPPRRPQPGRGRGRPRMLDDDVPTPDAPPQPLPPLTPLDRHSFDYSGLEAAMALADEAIGNARRLFATFPRQPPGGATAGGAGVDNDEVGDRIFGSDPDDPECHDGL